MTQEVIQRELARHHATSGVGDDVLVHGALGLFDQRHDVAHAQDARSHPVRMEEIEVLELLAVRGKDDGSTNNTTGAQDGTTTGVVVELGHNQTTEFQGVVEGARRLHGILSGHGVNNEEAVVRVRSAAHGLDFGHEGFVNGETTGGVDDDHVATDARCFSQSGASHGNGIGRRAEDVHADLTTEYAELFYGGGPLKVGGDEVGLATLLFEPAGQLRGRSRLTGTLETGQENHGWRVGRVGDLETGPSEYFDELFVNGLDYLLAGRKTLTEGHTIETGLNGLNECSNHAEFDVGFEQCGANFT